MNSTKKKGQTKRKQTNKIQSKEKKLKDLEKKNLCWMKLVGVVPSSSTCTRK
jgi:ribosomal protein S30